MDRVIQRNLQSCKSKASAVTASTLPYFIRYASYTAEYLEARIDAAETSWFLLLTKYDVDTGSQMSAHKHLRETSERTRQTLGAAQASKGVALGAEVPKALGELLQEVKQVFAVDESLLDRVRPKISDDDIDTIENKEKTRRIGMMKKDGHLWCATYFMRSLTTRERELFPPGVPGMAKSAMMMAGNWQFSRLVMILLIWNVIFIICHREFQFAPEM